MQIKRYYEQAFEVCDGASLAVFRIILGILLMKDVPVFRYIGLQALDGFRSSYHGFEWLQSDPALIKLCAYVLPFLAFCVTIGLFYRFAMPLTTIIIGYIFLIAPEYYLNHYYMLLLFCVLMSFMPASAAWSVDARLSKKDKTCVPAWSYWALKIQTEIILIYAGLVKINADWLQLQPLGTWLKKGLHDIPFLGTLFFFDTVIAIGAYGVIALHVIGAPLLFWRKTRPWVFALYVCFHLSNAAIFNIGIFPYMTIGATLLFFAPDWPKRFIDRLKPYLGTFSSQMPKFKPSRKFVFVAICIWLIVQITIPLRPFMSSNLKTEWYGHADLFTWRMMLNNKSFKSIALAVHVPERRRIEFINLRDYLTEAQSSLVTARPNGLVEFANYLEDIYSEKYDTDDIKIHAYIVISINFREPAVWADPTINLAVYDPKYGIHEWIRPLENSTVAQDKYISPSYRDVLMAMNLSEEEVIVFDKADVSLDTRLAKPKWGEQ